MELDPDLFCTGRLLAKIDRVLERSGFGGNIVLPCLGLEGTGTRDVDLQGLRGKARLKWPALFVGVNPGSEELVKLSWLFKKDEDLAVFLAMEMLTKKSPLLKSAGSPPLELAARRAIEGP